MSHGQYSILWKMEVVNFSIYLSKNYICTHMYNTVRNVVHTDITYRSILISQFAIQYNSIFDIKFQHYKILKHDTLYCNCVFDIFNFRFILTFTYILYILSNLFHDVENCYIFFFYIYNLSPHKATKRNSYKLTRTFLDV